MNKNEMLKAVFDRISVYQTPISIADPDQEDCPLIFVNKYFLDLTGYSEEDVIGRNCRFLQGQDTDPAAIGRLKDSLTKHQNTLHCILNYTADGEPFHNLLVMSRIQCDQVGDIVVGCQSKFGLAENNLNIRQKIARAEGVMSDVSIRYNDRLTMVCESVSIRSRALSSILEHYIKTHKARGEFGLK